MRSTIAIDVAAPADLVFALARDVGRWERLLPHYARSRAVERAADGSVVVDFVARRPVPLIGVLGLGLPVAWRARTWNEPATRRLRFVHVAGATQRDGRHLADRADRRRAATSRSTTTSARDSRRFAPFVDRAFTRPIAGRTLATFKALAEALAP